MNGSLLKALELFEGARRVLVLTGAGMSAESGVPTFRDAQTGLWARYDPRELATPEAYRRNPSRVFGWYASRLMAVRRVSPHVGYDALARLGEMYPGALTVVTQNVDGLHTRAGTRDVIELHGSLEAFRCSGCRDPYPAAGVVQLVEGGGEIAPRPPECSKCGNFIRPGVVWFGEMLPEGVMERAWQAAREADVALVIGTSSMVYPAAELPAIVVGRGGRVIEINPEATPLSPSADLYWQAAAGEALPELVEALQRRARSLKDGKTEGRKDGKTEGRDDGR